MRSVIILTAEPKPGLVKQRLAASIGDASAARFHEAFLHDTLASVRALGDTRLGFCFAPVESRGYFAELAPEAELVVAKDHDLATRVAVAHGHAIESEQLPLLFLGTNLPQLAAAEIEAAFDALSRADVVVGPTSAGGHYLFGVQRAQAALIEEVEWEDDDLDSIQSAADHLNLGLELLAERLELDTYEDLLRHFRASKEGAAKSCPATRALLRELGIH